MNHSQIREITICESAGHNESSPQPERHGQEHRLVAGYPEDPDLFLSARARVEPATGEFEFEDTGEPITDPVGLLVR